MEEAPAPENGKGPDPRAAAEAVGKYLGLTQDQAHAWGDILKATGDAIHPIGDQIRDKEKALHDLLGTSNPSTASVGQLVVDIKNLRGQIDGLLQQGATQFIALLTADQKAKLDGVRAAAPICPVVPAFAFLHLL